MSPRITYKSDYNIGEIIKLNKKAMRLVISKVNENPLRLNMNIPLEHKALIQSSNIFRTGRFDHEWPACGTIGCFAGWSSVLFKLPMAHPEMLKETPGYIQWSVISQNVQKYMGMPNTHLFHLVNWPEKLKNAYTNAKTIEERAVAFSNAVEAYILKFDREKHINLNFR